MQAADTTITRDERCALHAIKGLRLARLDQREALAEHGRDTVGYNRAVGAVDVARQLVAIHAPYTRPDLAPGYSLVHTRNAATGRLSLGLYGPNGTDGYIGHFGGDEWEEGDTLAMLRAYRATVAALPASALEVVA